ncbi:MAG: CNNM domain-containing protein [Planctomycetota bacterium]
MVAVFLLLAVLLILLNAFFVLAEFAAVKVRPTRIQELVDSGDPRALLLQRIHEHLDEYLSVCQIGITIASIALGYVGEPSVARLVRPLVAWAGTFQEHTAHGIAVAISLFVFTSLHVVLGEQVPKMAAIRRTDAAALWSARPLILFRWFLYPLLWLLSRATNAVLRGLGLSAGGHGEHHSEDELRILLEESQEKGMMSFRRLLLMENVFDLGDVRVRDAMRVRHGVKVLRTDVPWEENLKTIKETRFSRYPLIEPDSDKPAGTIHVKDILYQATAEFRSMDLKRLARPFVMALEDSPLENLLADLQRRRAHVAIVFDKEGRWTGFLTLEDIIEEIIGTVEDEFEVEPPLFIADALTAGRIVLGVKAGSIEEAVRAAFARVAPSELPAPAALIEKAVVDRERTMGTYLGRGLAIPHARLEGIERPALVFARSEEGIPVKGREDRAHLLFILLTPAANPRVQARMLARIGGLLTSEYVEARLLEAETPNSVLEAIRAADPVALG